MIVRSIVAGLIMGVAMPPCAAGLDLNDEQAVARAIDVKHDEFQKLRSYDGPNAAPDVIDQLFIRAWKNDVTEHIEYQIYLMDFYTGEWRFYDRAFDSDGQELQTTEISRKVVECKRRVCSHLEHLGIKVTRVYLETKQESGVRFKVIGKSGEEVFYIPPAYIRAFLSVTK